MSKKKKGRNLKPLYDFLFLSSSLPKAMILTTPLSWLAEGHNLGQPAKKNAAEKKYPWPLLPDAPCPYPTLAHLSLPLLDYLVNNIDFNLPQFIRIYLNLLQFTAIYHIVP